jgi:hypothetical protein
MAHLPENILKQNEQTLTRITALYRQLERKAPESRLNEIRADSETIIKDILAVKPFVDMIANNTLVNQYFDKHRPAGLLTGAERGAIASKYSGVELNANHSRSLSGVR